MKKIFLFVAICLSYNINAQVKILFDASHAQTAGSADWIIDADQHNMLWGSSGPYISTSSTADANAQQTPTPAQSGITASTIETYWDGAISAWAVDCVKKGYQVSTLPYTASITYGNTSNPQDLSNYKIFVLDEPNVLFTTNQKKALMDFVGAGGSLFLICDHETSDRNNDNYDSRQVLNDLFKNNSVLANPFGMSIDSVDISQISTNVMATATDSLIHGTNGNVTKLEFNGGATITIDPNKNSTVKAVIYKNGTSAGNTNVMCAYARYKCGKVVLVGDSSPFDDGTGDPNDVLYDGYIAGGSGNHKKLILNATDWLSLESCPVVNVGFENKKIIQTNIFPNPANNNVQINANENCVSSFSLINIEGKKIMTCAFNNSMNIEISNLVNGIYFYTIQNENGIANGKLVIQH
jgi:hypothetical protein